MRGAAGGPRAPSSSLQLHWSLVIVLCIAAVWLGFAAGHASGRASAAAVGAGAPPALHGRGLPADAGAAVRSLTAAEAWARKPPPGSDAAAALLAGSPSPGAPPSARAVLSACHRRMTTRGELPGYLSSLGLYGDGAEVGVRDGDFSEHTLANWVGHTGVLHLVDRKF